MEKNEQYESFKKFLADNTDEKYKAFHQRLIPNVENFCGIRVPVLKKEAKKIAKENWEDFLSLPDSKIYEERMVKGFIICYAKMPFEKRLEYFKGFINLIDNWAVCDCVCSAFKVKKEYEKQLFDFAAEYALRYGEYEARVGIVLLMGFIDEEHIESVLNLLGSVKQGAYYTDMALAWAISICIVKFKEKTLEFMTKAKLSDFVYNKAIQKACESLRITNEEKKVLRKLKR